MSDAEKLHADITAALARLAKAHGVDTSPAPTQNFAGAEHAPRYIEHRAAPTRRPAPTPSAAPRGRDAVNKNERDLEGRYAEVAFSDGPVTCYIDSVERRAGGTVKAYVLRLDRRTREYVTLDRLENVRDDQ